MNLALSLLLLLGRGVCGRIIRRILMQTRCLIRLLVPWVRLALVSFCRCRALLMLRVFVVTRRFPLFTFVVGRFRLKKYRRMRLVTPLLYRFLISGLVRLERALFPVLRLSPRIVRVRRLFGRFIIFVLVVVVRRCLVRIPWSRLCLIVFGVVYRRWRRVWSSLFPIVLGFVLVVRVLVLHGRRMNLSRRWMRVPLLMRVWRRFGRFRRGCRRRRLLKRRVRVLMLFLGSRFWKSVIRRLMVLLKKRIRLIRIVKLVWWAKRTLFILMLPTLRRMSPLRRWTKRVRSGRNGLRSRVFVLCVVVFVRMLWFGSSGRAVLGRLTFVVRCRICRRSGRRGRLFFHLRRRVLRSRVLVSFPRLLLFVRRTRGRVILFPIGRLLFPL